MSRQKTKNREQQAQYRKKVRQAGGIYVGGYLKGEAATRCLALKKQKGGSFSALLADLVMAQTKPVEPEPWKEIVLD